MHIQCPLIQLSFINRLPLPNVNDNVYTRKKRVINVEKLHPQGIICPKSLATDRQGRLYVGTLDGKVCSVQNDDKFEVVTSFAKGRPLGMRITTDNVLYFVEANSGLYAYDLERKDLKHLLGNDKGIRARLDVIINYNYN